MCADTSGLNNQFQLGQFFNQLAGNMGSLPVEHNDVSIFQSYSQLAKAFDGVGVDLCLVRFQLGSAFEFPNGILVIVKYYYIHSP